MPDDQQPNYNPVGADDPAFEQQNPFTIADGSAMPRKAMRDVVVCLPGITGSVLQKNGRDVWNISGGAVINALTTLGHSIGDLKLENDPPDVDDLGDGDHRARGDPRRPSDPRALEDRRLHEDAALHRGDVRRHAGREPLRVPVRLAARQPRRRAPAPAREREVAEGLARSRAARPTRSSCSSATRWAA